MYGGVDLIVLLWYLWNFFIPSHLRPLLSYTLGFDACSLWLHVVIVSNSAIFIYFSFYHCVTLCLPQCILHVWKIFLQRALWRHAEFLTKGIKFQMSTEMQSVASRLHSSGLLRTQGLIGGKWTNAYDGKTLEVCSTKFIIGILLAFIFRLVSRIY